MSTKNRSSLVIGLFIGIVFLCGLALLLSTSTSPDVKTVASSKPISPRQPIQQAAQVEHRHIFGEDCLESMKATANKPTETPMSENQVLEALENDADFISIARDFQDTVETADGTMASRSELANEFEESMKVTDFEFSSDIQ